MVLRIPEANEELEKHIEREDGVDHIVDRASHPFFVVAGHDRDLCARALVAAAQSSGWRGDDGY
jgi:hypothetical protein